MSLEAMRGNDKCQVLLGNEARDSSQVVLTLKRVSDDSRSGRIQRNSKGQPPRHVSLASTASDPSLFDDSWAPETHGHDFMPVPGVVVSIVVDLIPFGLCCLSGCMASSGIGWLPAAALILVFSALSSHTMGMIGRTANTLAANKQFLELTYTGLWKVLIGRASWLPSLAIVAVCFGNCIASSCFFADSFALRLPEHERPCFRSKVLLVASVFPLLPLCTFRDLSSLSNLSSAVVPVLFYLLGFMAYRAYDGSYQEEGDFFRKHLQPEAPDRLTDAMFKFGSAPMLFTNALTIAYLAHYNGMKYYRELKNNSLHRFTAGVLTAHIAAALFYTTTVWLGHRTFGSHTTGALLSNYHHGDDLARLTHMILGFAVLLSYPLMFAGLREAAVSMLKEMLPAREELFKKKSFLHCFTCVLLSMITCIAYFVTDVWLVVGLVGSVLGSVVVYMMPAALFIQAHKKNSQCRMGLLMARMIFALGLFLSISGCYSACCASLGQ